MPGRNVNTRAAGSESRRSRRALAWALAGLVLLAIGIVIGRASVSPQEGSTPPLVDTASAPSTSDRSAADKSTAVRAARTPAGAVAAATASITAFDGDVLLEPARLRAVVARIAAAASRARLIDAFGLASAQTRAKLGADTIPRPVIVLRAVPAGYRIEHFSPDEATVAIWYVGIVGSGATVQPQQSWRTQTVTLVWEDSTWKVRAFDSSPGPTPALATTEAVQAPGELFTTIPRFEEFKRALP